MKSENSDPASRFQAGRQVSEKSIESGELVVDRNSQRLENAPDRDFPVFFSLPWQGGANGLSEREGRAECFAGERSRQAGIRFVGVLEQQARELFRRQLLQKGGRGHAAVRI